jgi:hypothetical protein
LGWEARDVEGLAAAEDGGGGGKLGVDLGVAAGGGSCGGGDGGDLSSGGAEEALGFEAAVPVALLVDADGDDLVALAVDGLEDGAGGEERDFVLAGAAAEENAYSEFLLFHD